MDTETGTYYMCMLCAQLECDSKLIQLQADEAVLRKVMVKLSRLNILYDYDKKIPKNICESCNDNLDKAFDFVAKVENAQHVLSDFYKNKYNLKEIDSDVSDDEQGEILKNEYHGNYKDEQTDSLEKIKCELPDDRQSYVFDNQQCDTLEHQQNDSLDHQQYQRNDNLEDLKSDISEHLDSLSDKTDRGAGLDFEIYSQSSNSSVASEGNSSCESVVHDKIKKSRSNIDTTLTWNQYLWTCSICDTQFSTHEDLKLHSVQYHQICNPLKCHECNIRKLHLKRFIVHVQRHRTYLKFMCYKCNCKFSCTRALNNHTRVAHGPRTKYVCPGCNADFESSQELQVHTESFYRGKRFRHVPDELISDVNSLSCDTCKRSFKNKRLLYSHLFIHTERKKDHICDICGKGFVNINQLRSHSVSHKDKQSYECSICKSTFKTLRCLTKHVAIHSGEKPHKCDQCGKGFRLKKYLNSHLIIHTNSLPYDCIYCDKKFRFKSIRDQHIRQHTGFKPYSCEICSRDFTNWSNYNKHMKRRHDLNLAKRKWTPEGVFPINPSTGKIIKYDTNETLASKSRNVKGKAKKTSSSHKRLQSDGLEGAQSDISETQ